MLDIATSLRMARVFIPILVGGMLIASVVFAIESATFIRNAKSATATITSSAERASADGDTLYQPTFAFTASGRTYTDTPRSFVSPRPGAVGEHVSVRYDARNPNRARIDTFVYTWMIPVLLLVLSIIFSAIYLTAYWIFWRVRRTTSSG